MTTTTTPKLENLIFKNLLKTEPYLRKVLPFLKPDYFQDQSDRLLFSLIHDFVEKYNTAPTTDALIIEVGSLKIDEDQNKAILATLSDIKADTTVTTPEWMIDETEKFCKHKAAYQCVLKSIDILKGNSPLKEDAIPEMMKEAVSISFDTNVGHDFLEGFKDRFEYYHAVEEKIPFDLDFFNKITNGGVLKGTLNVLIAGTGGCHTKGTKVLMDDGRVKKVEDIVVGDKLKGDDGLSKNVISLVRGIGRIYRVKINSTNEFMDVNEDHILSLISSDTDEMINISVKEYLKKNTKWKHRYKMFYSQSISLFPKKELIIDPYFMGVYLGDGHTHNCAITNMDEEINEYCRSYVSINYPELIERRRKHSKATTTFWHIDKSKPWEEIGVSRQTWTRDGNRKRSRLAADFTKYGLFFTNTKKRTKCADKFIPFDYKTSSPEDRLAVLAGIIDSDGYCKKSGTYEIVSKSKQLIEDVSFIARSLAMMTKIKERIIKGKTYFKVVISTTPNSPQRIPSLLERKKGIERRYNKISTRSSFGISYIGDDDYFGFNVDGNNLYCLDNFLVTHNCKSLAMSHFAAASLAQGKNVLYLTMELSEKELAKRIDANLMDIAIDDLLALPEDMYEKKAQVLKQRINGKLIIKQYPTSMPSAQHFRSLLNELRQKKSFKPDVVFVDYLNICASSRLKRGQANSYEYVKAIAEELRGLAVEWDFPMWTATQLNRTGFDSSDPDMDNTADSFGLPMTADFMCALVSSEELEKLGQLVVKQLKNRYKDPSINKRFVIGVNKGKMKLFDVTPGQQNIQGANQPSPVPIIPNKFTGLKVAEV